MSRCSKRSRTLCGLCHQRSNCYLFYECMTQRWRRVDSQEKYNGDYVRWSNRWTSSDIIARAMRSLAKVETVWTNRTRAMPFHREWVRSGLIDWFIHMLTVRRTQQAFTPFSSLSLSLFFAVLTSIQRQKEKKKWIFSGLFSSPIRLDRGYTDEDPKTSWRTWMAKERNRV